MRDSSAHAPVAAIQTQLNRRRSRRRTTARNPSAASSVDSTNSPDIQARLACACRSGARPYDSAPIRNTVPSSIWMIACRVARARNCAARTCRNERAPPDRTDASSRDAMPLSVIRQSPDPLGRAPLERQPVAGLEDVGVAEAVVLEVVAVRDLEGSGRKPA